MKKSTTNTFTGGLNLDLNPLNTPSDILTDCVNGALITFNGDELILQNDAGNSKITIYYPTATLYNEYISYRNGSIVYTEDEEKIYYKNISGLDEDNSSLETETSWQVLPKGEVSLSPDFFPIGVKEYGGVLYIISAKNTQTATEFVPGSHNMNTVVYTVINGKKLYYKCLATKITTILPLETNSDWEYIGDFLAFNNYFGEVEFGSYPSPEFGGAKTFSGTELEYIETEDTVLSPKLYKPNVINDIDFKAGASLNFTEDSGFSNTNNFFSHYINDAYQKQFYKVKLYHQLENGYLDLTDSIWDVYKTFKGTTTQEDFWFNDSLFVYPCQTNYKGKLAISLELEEFTLFEVLDQPNIQKINNVYTFLTTLRVAGTKVIEAASPVITLTYENIEVEVVGTLDSTETIDGIVTNTWKFSEALEATSRNTILTYRIDPIVSVNSIDITEDIPQDYLLSYIKTGQLQISVPEDEISFLLKPNSEYDCDPDNGIRIWKEFILVNSSGDYIDTSLVPTATPHVYVLDGEVSTLPLSVLLGNYTVLNTVVSLVEASKNTDLPEWVHNEFVSFEGITVFTKVCGLIDIRVSLNYIYGNITNVTITQGGETLYAFNKYYGDYWFSVLPIIGSENNYFNVNINVPEYEPIVYENLKVDVTNSVDVPYGGAERIFDENDVLVGAGLRISRSLVPKKIQVDIQLNVPLSDGSVVLTQKTGVGDITTFDTPLSDQKFIQVNAYLYRCEIDPDKDFSIKIFNKGFLDIEYSGNIDADTTFKFALISDIKTRIVSAYVEEIADTLATLYISWEPDIFLGGDVSINVHKTSDSSLYKSTRLFWNDKIYDSLRYEQIVQLDPANLDTYTTVDETALSNEGFANITTLDESNYRKKIVFDKTFILPFNVPYNE